MSELKYVKSAQDLVTPIDVTQSGFLQQALRKTKEASPYIERAKHLLEELHRARLPQDLISINAIWGDLITAAGFSDKATNYFSPSELRQALLKVLKEIENKASSNWRTEVVYRFLLTRGDTLGGVMRNILGTEAKAKFAEAILALLKNRSIIPKIAYSKTDAQKVREIS